MAGHPKGDFALGLVIALASLFLFGLGLLVMPILYLVLRSAKPPYKAFARGIGWGALVGWALILGAVAWCFYGLSHEGYHG